MNREGLEEVITDGDADKASVLAVLLGDIVVSPERKLI